MDATLALELPTLVERTVPLLLDFPARRFWVDYDQEADVLYISFDRPQRATNTELTEAGILFRYRDHKLVGMTVLDASTRLIGSKQSAS